MPPWQLSQLSHCVSQHMSCSLKPTSPKATSAKPSGNWKGSAPQNNLELIEGSPLHFVDSLPPSDHPDLLAVPKSRYRTVDPHRFPDPRTTMRYNRARQSLDRHAT